MELQRHHWTNTIVGHLDAAFHLSDEELFDLECTVVDILDTLRIPDRGTPAAIPAALASEVTAQLWSAQLAGQCRDASRVTHARLSDANDAQVSLEAWRNALMTLITVPYPDLAPLERVLLTKTFDDALSDLGIPGRAASFIPEIVIPHHLDAEA